jgi:tetratricopeptide (TPR) repeat protein
MQRLLAAVVAFSLTGVPTSPSDPQWTRAATEHFVVSGDAPAADIGQVAARLESLRSVLTEVLPRAQDHSLLPAFVIVFGTDRAFKAYRPAEVTVGGYALREPFIPCLVLRSDRSDDSFRTIVREYVHLLFDAPGRPLWLSEGIADYYGTTTLTRDRRHVVLGERIPVHLAQASRWWVPLSQVLSVARSAELSNGDTDTSFYAESWLLVHYLMRGTPARGAQIARFLDLLAGGTAEATAFEQAIGPRAKIEVDLRRYLSSGIVHGEERALTGDISLPQPRSRAMSAAEVEATLGRLLFHLRRDEEALARLDASLALDPDLAEAAVIRGAMDLRQGRRTDALARFRHAMAREPANAFVAYNEGLLALEGGAVKGQPPLEEAYAALRGAAEGRRELPPELLATYGTVAGRLGRVDEAESLLRRANALEPGQSGTRLELANVCLRVGQFDEAREILDDLASRRDSPHLDMARLVRDWLVLAEARARIRAELAGIAGLRDAGPDLAIARTGSFPAPFRVRAPGVGEEQRLGLLDAIDCPGAQFVARVTTRSGPLSLVTASLAGVHLSSARDDVSGALACGARAQREAVYVTWKNADQLVALEFLPRDLQPGR